MRKGVDDVIEGFDLKDEALNYLSKGKGTTEVSDPTQTWLIQKVTYLFEQNDPINNIRFKT